jgi:phenylacetate-CoA ligase
MKIAVYRILPEKAKRAVRWIYSLLPAKLRMERGYRDAKKFIYQSQHWQNKEIELYQFNKLKEIITYAFYNVPGYHQLFREAHVSPEDFRQLADIRNFPFTTKELLRDNLDDFTSRAIPRWKLLYRTTGGSTGIPFGFYLIEEDVVRELAFLHSAWERVGWKFGDRSAVLRGAYVGSEEKFWQYDPFLREMHFSSYYLNQRTYQKYKKKLLSTRIRHLQAYPSAAALFSDLVISNGDEGKLPFRLLLLGSENLYDWQKEKIAKAFPESKIFSWYGHAEQVLFAPMCEHSEHFHLDPFYGFAEILDQDNRETAEGQIGELVGTSLWNKATPFIRYRTMDLAKKGAYGCEKCGRQYQLLSSIEGRLQELVVTKTGRYISMTAINMHSDIFDHVKQFQFHQREMGKVVFKIVRGTGYTEKDSQKIYAELTKKLGNDMELELAFVDSIEKPKSGKFRFLIQEIPTMQGNDARH